MTVARTLAGPDHVAPVAGQRATPIVIAIVLSEVVEKFLWLSTNTYGWSMFQRPQFLAIIAAVGVFAVIGIRVQKAATQYENVIEDEIADASGTESEAKS